MNVLTKKNMAKVSGGGCTGGGSSSGASLNCSATIYENKKNQTSVSLNLTGNTRQGATAGGVTFRKEF